MKIRFPDITICRSRANTTKAENRHSTVCDFKCCAVYIAPAAVKTTEFAKVSQRHRTYRSPRAPNISSCRRYQWETRNASRPPDAQIVAMEPTQAIPKVGRRTFLRAWLLMESLSLAPLFFLPAEGPRTACTEKSTETPTTLLPTQNFPL